MHASDTRNNNYEFDNFRQCAKAAYCTTDQQKPCLKYLEQYFFYYLMGTLSEMQPHVHMSQYMYTLLHTDARIERPREAAFSHSFLCVLQ